MFENDEEEREVVCLCTSKLSNYVVLFLTSDTNVSFISLYPVGVVEKSRVGARKRRRGKSLEEMAIERWQARGERCNRNERKEDGEKAF